MDDVQELIVREIPQLRRFAFSLTRNEHAADDLVQDGLERAIRKRHQWKRHGSIRGWLYRVIYSVFLNKVAKANPRHGREEALESDHLSAVPANQFDRAVCRNVSEAVGNLPADQRTAIILTAVEGFSYDEAADIMDVPIGTLRSRLFRGRETLRVVLDWGGQETSIDRKGAEPSQSNPRLQRVK